ncbi:hypothetical protein TBC1_111084 [Lentimicrobium saccharophilum]|uniref:CcmD family protein n=1 Tax=Lentimicrobium saccharophilum TaxID=1678841 RepID=A0A0S7C2I4_9BACT|nr:hypothetical protein [Lentimicrobium saccharophilum]GAP42943.1 hypothetical protein TBC1_111084 [Lentimicrobium saccharophilum]
MKKALLIFLLLSGSVAFAGTGSANDAILLYLAIIAVMSIITAVLHSVDFIRRILRERKERKLSGLDHHTDGQIAG